MLWRNMAAMATEEMLRAKRLEEVRAGTLSAEQLTAHLVLRAEPVCPHYRVRLRCTDKEG